MQEVELQMEAAYQEWKADGKLTDATIQSVETCFDHTGGREIDRMAEKYPTEFLTYIDRMIRERNK